MYLKTILAKTKRFATHFYFSGSVTYWERRYQRGRNSGAGSYNQLASFKARVLNNFVIENQIQSIIEFGCGDSNQLTLAKYPAYIGLDVSQTAIEMCKVAFANDTKKSFYLYHPLSFVDHHNLFVAELGLSIDVLYHLVEDDIYYTYLDHLFNAATKYIIIYSSNYDGSISLPHIKHRLFYPDVKARYSSWELVNKIDNPNNHSSADFYFFANTQI